MPDEQAILIDKYLMGKTLKEISKQLDVPLSTIFKKIQKILRKVKTTLCQ